VGTPGAPVPAVPTAGGSFEGIYFLANGSFVRNGSGSSPAALEEAWVTLRDLHTLSGLEFLSVPDFSYVNVPNAGLRGVKQITDAWLAERARQNNCTLATFDKGLASQHPDVAYLIP
jgi:predicted nucleic acid-binding protein